MGAEGFCLLFPVLNLLILVQVVLTTISVSDLKGTHLHRQVSLIVVNLQVGLRDPHQLQVIKSVRCDLSYFYWCGRLVRARMHPWYMRGRYETEKQS